MNSWHKRMLKEYRGGRKQLRKRVNALGDKSIADKEDKKTINSAIRDMDFVIKWLETGIQPDELHRRERYKAYNYSKKFVYGVNGYWDDSIGAFIDTGIYKDPYKEVEDRIDKELEEKRRARYF